MSETSTKSYLVRAIYEWCTDSGFTPYIAVFVDNSTNMPHELVKNDKIVLNVSFNVASQLDTDNEWIVFRTRFPGVSRKIEVSIGNVLAVYARENGQGMAFPVERNTLTTQAATECENSPPPKLAAVGSESAFASALAEAETDPEDEPTPPDVPRIDRKPALKVVK